MPDARGGYADVSASRLAPACESIVSSKSRSLANSHLQTRQQSAGRQGGPWRCSGSGKILIDKLRERASLKDKGRLSNHQVKRGRRALVSTNSVIRQKKRKKERNEARRECHRKERNCQMVDSNFNIKWVMITRTENVPHKKSMSGWTKKWWEKKRKLKIHTLDRRKERARKSPSWKRPNWQRPGQTGNEKQPTSPKPRVKSKTLLQKPQLLKS